MQKPDFQENEYTYDDLNLEVDIGSGKYFLLLFFVNEVLSPMEPLFALSHNALEPI